MLLHDTVNGCSIFSIVATRIIILVMMMTTMAIMGAIIAIVIDAALFMVYLADSCG